METRDLELRGMAVAVECGFRALGPCFNPQDQMGSINKSGKWSHTNRALKDKDQKETHWKRLPALALFAQVSFAAHWLHQNLHSFLSTLPGTKGKVPGPFLFSL